MFLWICVFSYLYTWDLERMLDKAALPHDYTFVYMHLIYACFYVFVNVWTYTFIYLYLWDLERMPGEVALPHEYIYACTYVMKPRCHTTVYIYVYLYTWNMRIFLCFGECTYLFICTHETLSECLTRPRCHTTIMPSKELVTKKSGGMLTTLETSCSCALLTYIHTYMHLYIHTWVIHRYIYTHVHTCTHIYVPCVYTYTDTYIL